MCLEIPSGAYLIVIGGRVDQLLRTQRDVSQVRNSPSGVTKAHSRISLNPCRQKQMLRLLFECRSVGLWPVVVPWHPPSNDDPR